ncbi:metal ABC transporter substrate-binding protein [Clostridium sp. JN-1]|jgi:zinc transport system substrate-binding protein|uniref:metal ABC transporter substrate-binding protein n=1 Tax=Clostridium sp. JN-1 TaxID=2483110 RepID=UPI000F0B832C|nr:metal ABC transporter substrate-binding protein [Clostridium sp. JN-1]
MSKKILTVFITALLIISSAGCSNSNKPQDNVKNSGSKIRVVVTFNAVREFAYAIGKDKVDITTLVPDGTEPHDFEPKAKDMENISDTKVFIYNGLGMENWTDRTLKAIDNKNLIVVDASKGSNPIKNYNRSEMQEHGQYDPHLWLSLKGAKIESSNIKDALIKADPSNKNYYEKNFNEFSKELDLLYSKYSEKFKSVSNKDFVTGHAAFAYLCRDFGLNQKSIEDVFATGEPSTKQLKELTDYCKKNNIKTIFMEDMTSPKVSETLAKEVNASVKKIYTIENREDNKNYIESMDSNLESIYNSLK